MDLQTKPNVTNRALNTYEGIYVGCMAVFVAFVVLTNAIGSKIFGIPGDIYLPVSILWYPLTFLVTDIVSEMYGPKRARFLVVMGFAMSVVFLVFSNIGMMLPAAPFYELDEEYQRIFGPVWRLLFGSMAAYLLAQFVDVNMFHFFKRITKGKHLWLRNNGSTMISQLVDTVTVSMIFLYKNEEVFSGSFLDLTKIMAATYICKIIIAALDTPLCYLGVALVERVTGIRGKDVT